MPVVFRRSGFRFFFFSNEGNPREPVHIHVRKAGGEAKLWIDPVSIASSDGFDARSLSDIVQMVEDERELIVRVWHGYFG